MRKTIVAAVAAGLIAGSASADSITTLFTGGNRGSNGGMVYYTLNVLNGAGIQITGFDINHNTPAGNGIVMDVYTRVGGHAGQELNSGAWALTSSGAGTGAGQNLASFIDVTDFVLGPGTYGIALHATGTSAPSGHEYTNGNGTNQNYSNADVSLSLGSATNAFFGPSVFQPRVWNGTIHYNIVPAPGAIALLGLAGLAGRRRRRTA